MLNLRESEVNLVEQVLQQGQKLRAAMVKSILSLDPFYSEIEPPRRMHAINMDEVKFEEKVSMGDKHKFASYLRGDAMKPEEEKEALDTFRAMSTSEICEVTEKNFSSLSRHCQCDTCLDYKRLRSFDGKEDLVKNEEVLRKKQDVLSKNQSLNQGFLAKNPNFLLKNQSLSSKSLGTSSYNLDLSLSDFHLKNLRFVDTLRISVHSVRLGDEGWMKVCQGGKVIGGNVTLFVEYEVPRCLVKEVKAPSKGKVDSGLGPSNFVRICSKKMLKEAIHFKQISVHDVANLSELDLTRIEIKFKVSSRSPRQKAMNVLGEARFKMDSFLHSNYLSCNQDLVIFLNNEAPIALGNLKVSLELGCGRLYFGKSFIDSVSEGKENRILPEVVTFDSVVMDEVEKARNVESLGAVETVKVTAVKAKAKVKEKREAEKKKEEEIVKTVEKTVLFGFIYVSQVEYLDVKSDTYFTCQPFCQDDTAYSNVVTSSSNPLFNFYQKIPFIYEENFLSKLRDNFMLFEFWEKVDRKDNLIGVAKIPLHQYYLAFRNPTILKYLDRNQLPVIGTDWYEPISNPVTGAITGQAHILVALGSDAQIYNLEDERGFKDNIVKKATRILDRPIGYHPAKRQPIRTDLDRGSGCSPDTNVISRRSQLLQNAISGRSRSTSRPSKRSQVVKEATSSRNQDLEVTSGRSLDLEEGTSGRSQLVKEATTSRSHEYLEDTKGRSRVLEGTCGRSQLVKEATNSRSHDLEDTSGRSRVLEGTCGRSQLVKEATNRSHDLEDTSGRSRVLEGTCGRSQLVKEATTSRSHDLEDTSRRSRVLEGTCGRSQLVKEATTSRSHDFEDTSGRSQVLEGSIGTVLVGSSGRSRVLEGTEGRNQALEEVTRRRGQTEEGNEVFENASGRSRVVAEDTSGRSIAFRDTSGRCQVIETTSESQVIEAISGRSQVIDGISDKVIEDTSRRSQDIGERNKCIDDTAGRSQVIEDPSERSRVLEESTCVRSSIFKDQNLEGTSGRSQNFKLDTIGRSQSFAGTSGSCQGASGIIQPIIEGENVHGHIKCILSRDVSEIIISEVRRSGASEPEAKTFSEVGTQSNDVSIVSKVDKSTNKVLTFDRACQSDTMDSDQSQSDVLGNLLQQLITHRPGTTHEASTNTVKSVQVPPKLETHDLTEPKDSFKARIVIDSALHLPSRKKCKAKKNKGKAIREEILPSTYVSFDSCQDIKMTQIVHRNVNPKWEYTCDASLPTELLTSNQKRLIFKVWKKGRNGGQEPNQQVDSVLGFAALDLTVLLAGLPTVQGWFNILDFSSKCNGQIKICLTPLEEINKRNLAAETKTPTPTSVGEPPESLSRALKRKFTELDEITQRLRSRLSNVTSHEESDTSNDEVADEFEQDINTLCIEDDYDTIDFVREAQDLSLMRVSHTLQKLQQNDSEDDNQTLMLSSTSEEYENHLEVLSSKSEDNSSDLDKQLVEGKQRIDTLLGKLSLGGFGGRFVSGCSDVGGSEEVQGREEEILKELGIEREFDARGLFDSRVFGELGGVRHAPDGDAE